MDDLDHSIHIAEYDWIHFCEESEDCSLLQPTLADLENSSLSDSEDSALETDQHDDERQSTVATTAAFQPSAVRPTAAEEHCTDNTKQSVEVNQSCTGRIQRGDLTVDKERDNVPTRNSEVEIELHEDSPICVHRPGENTLTTDKNPSKAADQITEVQSYSIMSDLFLADQSESTSVLWPVADRCHNVSVSASTDVKKADDEVPNDIRTFGRATSIQESDQIILQQAEFSKKKQDSTEGLECEADRSAGFGEEKERWFVTVNVPPMQQQRFATPLVKKKCRKKKRPIKTNPTCHDGQGLAFECHRELETTQPNESEGGTAMGGFTQSYQSLELPVNIHSGPSSESPHVYTTSSSLGEEKDVSDKQEMSHFEEAITTELTMDNNKCETFFSQVSLENPGNLPRPTLHDMFTRRDDITTESFEEDFEDSVEFFSTTSYDSDSYLSATESTEENQHLLDFFTEKEPVNIPYQLSQQYTPSITTENDVHEFTGNFSRAQATEMLSCDMHNKYFSTLSSSVAASVESSLEGCPSQGQVAQQSQSHENTVGQAHVVTPAIIPCTDHSPDTMPEDKSTCDNDRRSSTSHETLEIPDLTDVTPLPSDDLSGDQLGGSPSPLPPLPDLMVTPCSMEESPETYADSLTSTRPVYAVSAFWDEMEKLTIKDILQLRNGSPSPWETQAIQETDSTDAQTHIMAGDAQYLLPDGSLMDSSDNADSGYFTHLDDSKPDRSSCEFSVSSDFEEEYWQFIGASRNPSPDPQEDLKQESQRTTDSPSSFTSNIQEEDNMVPVGKETSVAVEQLTGQGSQDHTSNPFLSPEPACTRGITKRRSMHNIHEHLDTEIQQKDESSVLHDPDSIHNHLDIEIQQKDESSVLHDPDKSLSLSTCLALEENTLFDVSDSTMASTRTPAPLLSNSDILDESYRITFPEVFEYLFTDDDRPQNNSVAVYDSKGLSLDKAYDCFLSDYGSEMALPPSQDSQSGERKPIPIFSCSRPSARDLTFPELDYLLFPQATYVESEEEEDSSPIRVVSRYIQASDAASSVAGTDGLLVTPKRGCSSTWKRLFSMRRKHVPGRSWCRRSGAWVCPAEAHMMPVNSPSSNQALATFSEKGVTSFPAEFFRVPPPEAQSIHTSISFSKRGGLFPRLDQSDMCLVCIAMASWVLTSSDPRAADAWKTALLANVSAISAIQYLRHYLKKDPPQDDS